jgi:acid-sensing ion channel, other
MKDSSHFESILDSEYPMTVQITNHPEFNLKVVKPAPPPDDHKACFEASLLVHSPDLVPTFVRRSDFNEIRYGYAINIEVTPEIIISDDDLKKLDAVDRECYFDGERKLKFFKIYTQKNCEIECLTNFTNNQCICSRLYQPYNDKSGIRQCKTQSERINSFSCEDMLLSELVTSQYFSAERNCSCLQTCNYINYQINYNILSLSDDENATYITVRMNTDGIVLYRRYQQYSFSDVVSYVGGLLGLFAGISCLSIFELFYFFTLRLIGNLWKATRI